MTTLFKDAEPKESEAKSLGYTHLLDSKRKKKMQEKISQTLRLYEFKN